MTVALFWGVGGAEVSCDTICNFSNLLPTSKINVRNPDSLNDCCDSLKQLWQKKYGKMEHNSLNCLV